MREARRNGGGHEKEVCRDERGARREERTSREDRQRRSSRIGEREKSEIDISEGHGRQRDEKESR